MSWIEQIGKRKKNNKTWQDNENPTKFATDCFICSLHYESEIDSGVFNTEIDATPIRVVNAQFDGWRITKNGWHYALGKDLANHGEQDGWVGFGGRQGQHWFKFRLARVGYLHWSTKAWDDIGGEPSYKRQNLTHQTNTIEFPTDGSTQPICSIANWADVWKTPVGGSLSVLWRVDGNRLKEEITINQAGREWISVNRPPTTPINETYFGFVFQLDWSDIPKVYRQGILQDIEGDFADDGENIELKDALDRLLAFMPISDVRVPNDDPALEEHQPLRKRFYKDTDGKYYLLLGVRADILNSMPAGDLIFDPTVEYDISASNDDAQENNDTGYMEIGNTTIWFGNLNYDGNWGLRFLSVTLPDGCTIDTSYIRFHATTADSGSFSSTLYGQDSSAPLQFMTNAWNITVRDRTTEYVVCDGDTLGAWTSGYQNSPEIKAIIQELVDTYDYSSGLNMAFVDIYTTGNGERVFAAYENTTYDEARLHIEYSTGGTQVYKDSELKWDIRNLVNKDNQLKWDLLNLVNKDSQLKWDIFNSVNKDSQLKWDIRNLVNKDNQLVWDLLNLVNKDNQLVWDILNLVNKDLQAKWDIDVLVNKDIQLVWDMEGVVNKDMQLVWDLFNSVGKDSELKWDIFNSVGKDNQLKWDIDVLVNKDIQLVWDMEGIVNKDLQLVWDLFNLVYKDSELVWDILSSVYKDSQLLWDILNLVNKDNQLVWDIDVLVNKDMQLVWDMAGIVNKDTQLVWDILSEAGGPAAYFDSDELLIFFKK